MEPVNRSGKRPVVVITGASAGIGRAAVRRFVRGGYDVGLIARGESGLSAAADEVRRGGGTALTLPCDVSDASALDSAAEQVEMELGPIDVWVNNAMSSVFSPVDQMKPEEYKRVTEVTYLGYVYGTLSALKRMKPRDRGAIVQVGSALAYRSIPLQSAYCAAKHAIVGFTDSLRCELIHDKSNVHLTAVHMPAVNTPQFDWVKSRLPNRAQPVPPIFQPEVAAEAIFFAAHHRRRELWVARSAVLSILAQKLVPGLADHYLAANGYKAQQTDQPKDVDRPHNLWSPVDSNGGGDFGAHGAFDDQASDRSPMLAVSESRKTLQRIASIGLGLAVGTWAAGRVMNR
ncbi:SDR family oxidoreductase [Roseiconus nitratireducens]|uniref:SDR family oxidoreductase n=1 Tax=Roseiconus nitratireducens TaxID=2605748 RepID=A0A5M6D6E1_9BACT|nr:SDR family oxidoreductase [Roseiconus nitratireducens]KAA5541812.1 SDR family oxidoreductase [Roseiconus nitratireducens]